MVEVEVILGLRNKAGRVVRGYLVLEGLVQEVGIDLQSASCSYDFDNWDAIHAWQAKIAFTCVLVARWSPGLTDMGSRWAGLILWKIDKEKDLYERVGLLDGPPYEEEMLGWERRILKIA
jgi:hypothetical protein